MRISTLSFPPIRQFLIGIDLGIILIVSKRCFNREPRKLVIYLFSRWNTHFTIAANTECNGNNQILLVDNHLMILKKMKYATSEGNFLFPIYAIHKSENPRKWLHKTIFFFEILCCRMTSMYRIIKRETIWLFVFIKARAPHTYTM